VSDDTALTWTADPYAYPYRAFMAQVNDAKIHITASYWPSFLYDETECDDRRTEKGLCRGYFLLRVSNTCSVFISILLSVSRFIDIFSLAHRPLLRNIPMHQDSRRGKYTGSPLSLEGRSHMLPSRYIFCQMFAIAYTLHLLSGTLHVVLS
jgi:hypothetical protein